MKKSDHQLLVEIHEQVMTKLPTQTDLGRAKREIIKVVTTNRKSEVDKNGPSTPERRAQVEAVRQILLKAYKEGRQMSLHQACLEAWTPIKGGYPSPKALYEYCHDNETLF